MPGTTVVVAAAGAAWEPAALAALGEAGLVVLKRCVDVTDLLATGDMGQTHVAVVDGGLPGLDADAIGRLRRAQVRCVAITFEDDAARLLRLGVTRVLTSVEQLADEVGEAASQSLADAAEDEVLLDPFDEAGNVAPSGAGGRVVTVWGPGGAPGRTTLCAALSALAAQPGAPQVLLDLDPYHGSVAQHLGVLDEVSGLLSAARRVNEGALDTETLASCLRRVGGDDAPLLVLTGLPRADRWIEVRPGAVDAIVELAADHGDVWIDSGFSLEESRDGGFGRNQLTLDALEVADTIVVVGSADPTGLTRLARGLVELRHLHPDRDLHVVVNRMRDSLGWSAHDVRGMVEGYAGHVPVHFVTDDRAAIDRALVAGRLLTEAGESAVLRDVRAVLAQLPKSSQSPAPV